MDVDFLLGIAIEEEMVEKGLNMVKIGKYDIFPSFEIIRSMMPNIEVVVQVDLVD